jgi:hypothetical protein
MIGLVLNKKKIENAYNMQYSSQLFFLFWLAAGATQAKIKKTTAAYCSPLGFIAKSLSNIKIFEINEKMIKFVL